MGPSNPALAGVWGPPRRVATCSLTNLTVCFGTGCLGSGKNPFPLKKSKSICFKRVPENFWKLTFLHIDMSDISIPWMVHVNWN